MELVEGGTFAGLIEEHGRLTWHDTFAYGLQIAKALEHLHSTEIIHRDIKPANILITYEGVAKLADLGLAKQLGSEEISASTGLTMQGVAMGSPAYMPPEQIRSAKDSTASCDLYALGASMFQAMTGKLPFDGRSATEVMGKVLREPAPLVSIHDPTIPAGVVELIDRLLSKEPKGRPATATALIAEMEAVLQNPDKSRSKMLAKSAPASAPTAGNPAITRSNSGLSIVAKVLIALGVVFVLVFLYLVFRP